MIPSGNAADEPDAVWHFTRLGLALRAGDFRAAARSVTGLRRLGINIRVGIGDAANGAAEPAQQSARKEVARG